MAKILVACDCENSEVGRELQGLFREAGYNVYQALARKDLLNGTGSDIDLVIIDATRDGRRGLCLASRYRSCSSVGIVVIHHRDAEPDPIRALELGADDVLVRPFHGRELLARVNSLLRRMDLDGLGHVDTRERRGIRFKDWVLDLERRQLVSKSKDDHVPLTTAEYDMLLIFLQYSCRVLSREELSTLALGRPHSVTDRTLDVQVARLRKRLSTGQDGIEYIKSVRSVGYIFCARTHDIY